MMMTIPFHQTGPLSKWLLLINLVSLLTNFINASTVAHDDTIIKDESSSCSTKVENGECNSNPNYMMKHCLQECFESNDFATVGYYAEDNIKRIEHTNCVDIHEENEDLDSCEIMADLGECAMDPGFMIFNCAKSCLVCIEPG